MTSILAFDLATMTGVCFGRAGHRPRAWSVDLGKVSHEERFSRCIRMTGRYCRMYEPDVVAVEAPVGGKDASALLIGYVACVKGEAHRNGAKVVEYFPATVRKHFLGKALTAHDFPGKTKAAAKGAIKAAVMARCHLLGWEVETGDAADAAALWSYACAIESRDHQITDIGGLFAYER